MAASASRIPPLAPDDYTDEQRALVGDWSTLNFSRVIVQHPELYRVFLPFLDKLIRGSQLPPRDREILIIRCLALCNESYEAHHHVSIARNAAMTDADIAAAASGGAGLSPEERELAKATEELVRTHCISDETWNSLAQRYSAMQLMEIVFLVGCYALMAMATKSFGIELENDAESARRLAQLRQYT
jgi:alkylhydroperoxidase family enzyme